MTRPAFILPAAALMAAAALFASYSMAQPFLSGRAAVASASGQFQIVPPGQGPGFQQTGIVVTGEGTVIAKPDVARVTLGVETSNASAAGAQQDAASKMDAVMATLRNAGIPEKDVQTAHFDLSPDYDYSGRTPVLRGYRVTNLVVVTLRDLGKVGVLLDSVVASGATRLHGISFSVSDPTAAGVQGREQAMNDARTKAEQLARLGGVSLGQPMYIEETVSAPPVPLAAPAVERAAPVAQTPISPGTQEITTRVRVVYSIL